MPLAPGLEYADDLPHTITAAITMRMKIDSLNELPDDKKPPRDLWYKPYKLQRWLDEKFNTTHIISKEFVELDLEEVE